MKKRKVTPLDTTTPPPPAPSTTPPRDWGHHLAELEERVARRLSAVEERVGITRTSAGITPQAGAQRGTVQGEAEHMARMAAGYAGPPPGVVPPHVAQNLDRLLAWTEQGTWRLDGSPEENVRIRAILDHLHGLVLLVRNGEDVPTAARVPGA